MISLKPITQRLAREEKHIMVTGLSRSGKSTLFTSLMAQLTYRAQHIAQSSYDGLPLLSTLPSRRVKSIELIRWKDSLTFPYRENLQALRERRWPASTKNISTFAVDITLRRSNQLLQQLLGDETTRLVIHDYPGEWLMDLPMIEQSFIDWSAHTFAQQSSEPQKSLAQRWNDFVHHFDFTQPANEANTMRLIHAYRDYLQKAKADGVTRLQPGALLLPPEAFDMARWGFCPLPAKITANPRHPWVLTFKKRYRRFIHDWVTHFRDDFFRYSDKQIILTDLLEGLNYGKAYLYEMQETMNHLIASFVYGKRQWYERLHKPLGITKVAFVASKIDMIPEQEQSNLLALLKDITDGAQQQLVEQNVDFEHFVIAAITATKREAQDILFKDAQGNTHRVTFKPIPKQIAQFDPTAVYPFLKAIPPRIHHEGDIRSLHVDKLLDYMLRD
jgi:predicted YcjX-like family ATPase